MSHLHRRLPAFDRLDRIGGTQQQQVRDRAQRGEMLDRLMGRPVFAEADRIVSEDVHDTRRPSAPRCGATAARNR